MTTPTHRDWPDTSQWIGARGRGQPSQGYQDRLPASSPDSSSTSYSVDTDPSEDSSDDSEYVPESIPEARDGFSDFVGENSPNSLSELGLRDHSDPGPEGSHQGHGGRMSIDLLDPLSPMPNYQINASLVGPSRPGNDGRPAPHRVPSRTSSGSPSITSRRQYLVVETPPERERHGRVRGSSGRPNQEDRRPRRAEPVVTEEIRRSRRRSPRRRDAPPPPDFLRMVMMMQQLGTLKFFGDKGPIEANSWLMHIERNFSSTRCPEGFKTDVAVHYLMRDACNWWEGVKIQYAGTQVTWDSFRRDFERKYFPPEARDRMEAQFQNLVQGQRNVREYEAEFTRLRQYAHYSAADEPVVIRKFLRGLRPELKSRLVVIQYYSLFELVERAVDVEECIGIEQAAANRVDQRHREQQSRPRSQAARTGYRGRGQGQRQTQNRGAAGRGTGMDQLPVCFKCGDHGHLARACPKEERTTRPVPVSVICFTCNQPGHYANRCPVTHPTGQISQRVGLRTLSWEDERAAKRPAIEGRVYSLDKPEPSRPARGPVTGT